MDKGEQLIKVQVTEGQVSRRPDQTHVSDRQKATAQTETQESGYEEKFLDFAADRTLEQTFQ